LIVEEINAAEKLSQRDGRMSVMFRVFAEGADECVAVAFFICANLREFFVVIISGAD
jgi:hypothetical protein